MSGTYAKATTVPWKSSRDEIERTLVRYGATGFAYGTEARSATVAFRAQDRMVRFTITLPDRRSREFSHTPGRGFERTPAAQQEAYDQAIRQQWRALALVVKAKLEAVESGIVTFEQEFLPHVVVPGTGETVYEQTREALAAAYTEGVLARPLLQIGGAS